MTTNAGPRLLAGRYRLERPLAFGGLAEVWTATDDVLDRRVAIKMLRAVPASDPLIVERFRREATAAARLNHPNIVSVFDTVSEPGVEAVVMELVPGRTLRQQLDDEGRLSLAETVHVGVCIADALDTAHRADLVHRDVKPANILLTPAGRVLLADFGLVTAQASARDLTGEDAVIGTPKYLSPEQVLGVPVDGRADIYSLGVVLYECLGGRAPYVEATDADTALARLHRDATPISSVRPGVPRPLATLITQCMARSPEARPASAAEVRDQLVRLHGTITDDGLLLVDPTPSGALRPLPTTDAVREAAPPRLAWFVACIAAIGIIAVAVAVTGVIVDRRAETQASRSARPGSGEGPRAAPTTSPATTMPTTVPLAPPTIISVTEFDPAPGDGAENPEMLTAITDGVSETFWSTLCYDDRLLGPKDGVGLVFQFNSPVANATLEVSSPTAGWSASVYGGVGPAPVLLAPWGPPVAVGKNLAAGRVLFALGNNPTSRVLLWITQLATATSCKLPYAVAVSEVQITTGSS